MNLLDRKGLSQDERFRYATTLALICSVILGILTGLLRTFFESSLWLLPIGFGIAYIVRRYGRGVQTRFSVIAILFTIVAILLSDVVFNFGLMGLLSFESYRIVLTFSFMNDISQMAWLVSRIFTIFIAYSYSRVI